MYICHHILLFDKSIKIGRIRIFKQIFYLIKKFIGLFAKIEFL